MNAYRALVGLVCCATGCFRHLAQHPCDRDDAPPYCADTTTAAASTSTSTNDATSDDTRDAAPDTTQASHAATGSTTDVDSTTSTTGSATSTGSDTSGGPAPFCGDGEVQAELNEECDDGNASGDDSCSATCQRDRLIFTTSPPYFRGGMLHGLKGADNYCVSRAGMAGLPDPLNYRALLSDSTTDAAARLKPGGGRYVLIDGTLVADSFSAMFSEPLKHPIDLDELGQPAYVAAWTGTRHGTARAVPGDVFCGDWNDDGLNPIGASGWTDAVDATWVEADTIGCLAASTIYCVEQR